jgi:hypothetical protein
MVPGSNPFALFRTDALPGVSLIGATKLRSELVCKKWVPLCDYSLRPQLLPSLYATWRGCLGLKLEHIVLLARSDPQQLAQLVRRSLVHSDPLNIRQSIIPTTAIEPESKIHHNAHNSQHLPRHYRLFSPSRRCLDQDWLLLR